MAANVITTQLLATDKASKTIKKLINNINALSRSVSMLNRRTATFNRTINVMCQGVQRGANSYSRLNRTLTTLNRNINASINRHRQLNTVMNNLSTTANNSANRINQLNSTTRRSGRSAQAGSIGFRGLFGALVAGDLAVRIILKSFSMLGRAIKVTALHVGRVEELEIVLRNMGNTAGYSAATMQYYTSRMQELGIVTDAAQMSLTKMIRANFSLEKAMKLTRLAQDAAVISGQESSHTLAMLTHGIISLQPEVLRTYGVIVSLERAYKDWAIANNRTTQSLSGQEKQAIALNAVLGEAERIHGNYEAAMTSASKQLRSTTRYTKLMMEAFGDAALPAFREFVFSTNKVIHDMTIRMKENQDAVRALGSMLGWLVKATFDLSAALEQTLYYLGLSPRAWADMYASYKRATQSISELVKWLGGMTKEQIKMEERIVHVNALFKEQKEVIDSLISAEVKLLF